jgi:ATP-dependent DNA helicase RecG
MQNPATEKLIRILKLEAQTKYADKAVTRGLQSFTPAWLADAARNGLPPEWAESVAQLMREYSASNGVDERRGRIDALLAMLQRPGAPAPVREERRPEWQAEPVERREERPREQSRERGRDERRDERREERRPERRERTPRAEPAPRAAVRSDEALGLDAPVTMISGVGEKNAALLAKLGVHTIRDLLHFYPTRYDDYSALKPIGQLFYGEQVTVIGRIANAARMRTKGPVLVKATLEDASGTIPMSFFTSEKAVDHLLRTLAPGREVVVSGKVGEYLGHLTFQSPMIEPAEKEWLTGGSIVPVYPLTDGLQPLLLRRVMKRVSEHWSSREVDIVPAATRQAQRLMGVAEALREIHFPQSTATMEQARRRLVFEQLLVVQAAVLTQRALWKGEAAPELRVGEPTVDRLCGGLPYALTGAQRRAVRAIVADMHKPFAMHRLLQGDVGSGKTAVAAVAMAAAATVGAQSALMAPTEILAEQHFKGLEKLFESMRAKGALAQTFKVGLLTGSVKGREREAVLAGLADGSVQIAVGTHALIQDGVAFANLGFVAIDEQHRFGVQQRSALRAKGTLAPHTLVMTATPIPRTLSLTLYGDLDNTILDEKPPGRQKIVTHWFTPTERERAYAFIRGEVEKGRQAFVICPLVEESDKVEAKAAIEEHARLQREIFPKLKLGLLHGRMKPAEKDAAMQAFAANETQILVSTSVVEVGIDVPNATVMLIEGANRFGLSQLHQFRGRVGRGQHESYCLLVADSSSAVGDQRLQAIVSTDDGFKLAEADLEIRGPGEFFGTKQSGTPPIALIGLRDRDLLTTARDAAERIMADDPQLESSENLRLGERMRAFMNEENERGDAS